MLLLRAAVVMAGCGGAGGDGGGNPAAPSVQPFTQTLTGTVSTFGTTFHPMTTPRGGNLTLRVSWTGSTDLDLFLSPPTCNSLYPKNGCGLLAAADGVTNPETITRTVGPNETYKIWVDTLSLSESVNYTLTLTIQ